MKIASLVQTCGACPSQWEGRTDDNRSIYVRYRWGHLSITVGSKGGDITDAVMGQSVFEVDYGDGLDGVLEYEELKELTANFIEWPE